MQIVLLACLAAALVIVPAVNAQVAGCKSGTVVAAEGKGGSRKNLGNANTFAECVALVMKQKPDANGATLKEAKNKKKKKGKKQKNRCYAQMKQKSTKSAGSAKYKYTNCFIQKTGEKCKKSVDKLTLHSGKKRAFQWLDERGFCAVDAKQELVFWVKAGHDAFVTLSNDKSATNVIEVAIGTWFDTSSSIRERQKQSPGVVKKGGGHLDKKFWRPFWIRWKGGNIVVGEGTNPGSNSWMSAMISQDVFYIGITTGSGAEGDWAFGYDPTAGEKTPTPDPTKKPDVKTVPPKIEEGCVEPSTVGNGKGGTQKKVGKYATFSECVAAVKDKQPTANGVTWEKAKSGEGRKPSCYAEFGQTKTNTNKKYQNCLIKPTGTEPTPAVQPTKKPIEKPTPAVQPTKKPIEKPTPAVQPTKKPIEKPTPAVLPTKKPIEKPTPAVLPTDKPDGGCTKMVKSYPKQHSLGATCHKGATLGECKKICEDDDACAAIDWNFSDSPWQGCRCWVHGDPVPDLKANQKVDQYRQDKCEIKKPSVKLPPAKKPKAKKPKAKKPKAKKPKGKKNKGKKNKGKKPNPKSFKANVITLEDSGP